MVTQRLRKLAIKNPQFKIIINLSLGSNLKIF